MPVDLKRKVGPLPLWGWVLVAGGGIGAIILVKRSKGAKGEPTEPAAVLSGTSAPAGEGGVGSGGGASGQLGELTKTPGPELLPPTIGPTSPTYELGGFAGEVNDVAEGKKALEALGLVVPAGRATSSQAGAAAQARHKATGGNPRKGLPFKPIMFHGQHAHQYEHAVPGGVGPHHNIIVLPIGKKNHAAKGRHEPAHAKAKPKHRPAAKHRPTQRRPKARR